MTPVLAHGALGVWDEVIALSLLVIGLPTGVMFALLKGTSGRGTTPLRDDDAVAPGQPLDIKETAGPAPRIIGSDGEPDARSDKRGRRS